MADRARGSVCACFLHKQSTNTRLAFLHVLWYCFVLVMGNLNAPTAPAIQRNMPEIDAEKLRSLRADKVWTLQELENESGVPLNTIWRLEKSYGEQTNARQSTIRKLAHALGVEPSQLLR